jgi:hypothetical protein
MDGFDNMEWVEAVLTHPATEDVDLFVAVGLLVEGRANGLSRPGGVLIPQDAVDESVGLLTALGFVESVVAVPAADGEDHLLVLRMPGSVV